MTQCSNCGYQMGQHESNCKYCGTTNPSFKKESKPNYNFTFPSSSDGNETESHNFSWGIFIVLLIVFWPAAIIYIIINNIKKS